VIFGAADPRWEPALAYQHEKVPHARVESCLAADPCLPGPVAGRRPGGGITPKRAAQPVRFDHAVHLLAAGHDAASVAADSGYVDQSHLHREVKAFAGLTPAAVAVAPWLAIDDVAWPAS
jgi:helix-turn-helix protein